MGETIPDGEHTPHALPAPNGSAPDSGWVLAERYRVLEILGSGGSADVFRSRDELLRRDVAVKVFRTIVDLDGNPGGSERQAIEVQALAGLSHPNLITLFDASIAGSPAFLVMELVDGPSLAERLSAGPMPEADVRDVGAQIADALSYVHAQAMVHRDVKPANILLGVDGTAGPGTSWARLSDFGIVRLLDSARMTSLELTVGSASYLAPEQLRGADVGTEADIYSLGLVLLESLTGIRSFDGPPIEAAMARLTRSPEIPTTLPMPWPALLAAMTAAEPTARPNAAQVADALRNDQFEPGSVPVALSPGAATDALMPNIGGLASAGSTAVLALPDAAKHAQPRALRRRGLLVPVLALALAAIIGSAGWVLAQPASQTRTPPAVAPSTPGKPGHPVAPANNTHGSHPVTHAISVSATTRGVRTTPTSRPAPSRSATTATAGATTASATPSTPIPTPTPTTSTQGTGTTAASASSS